MLLSSFLFIFFMIDPHFCSGCRCQPVIAYLAGSSDLWARLVFQMDAELGGRWPDPKPAPGLTYAAWHTPPGIEWVLEKGLHLCVSKHLDIKGIVLPKMWLLSSITHPHVIPSLHHFLSSVNHISSHTEELALTVWKCCFGQLWCSLYRQKPSKCTTKKIVTWVLLTKENGIHVWLTMRVKKWC